MLTTEITAPVSGWLVNRKHGGVEVFTSPEGVEYVRGSFDRCDIIVTFTRMMGLQPLYLRRLNTQSKQRLQSLCNRHRLYQAIRKPRTNCEVCWDAYNSKADKVESALGGEEQGTSEAVPTEIPIVE